MIRGHRNGRQTPIIFITAYVDEVQTARGYALGAVDYIQTPVVAPVLRSKVLVFVDLYKANAALALSNQELETRVRERTAELEQLSRLKDEFLATMSHELRTPLNAIFGWVTCCGRGGSDEPTQERALETIERNARAQKRLIEDLLDVSRIVTGKVALEILPVNPQRVVEAALETMQPAAQQGGHGGPAAGHGGGDRTRRFRPFAANCRNLLSNAIKFTAIWRHAWRFTLAHRMGEAEISVSDSGQGIKPEFLPLVFDRFRQEDGSISRRHGGLGLGLAIVRHLVELHAGSVEAFSEGEEKGSRFVVRLPTRLGLAKNGAGEESAGADTHELHHAHRHPLAGRRRRTRAHAT